MTAPTVQNRTPYQIIDVDAHMTETHDLWKIGRASCRERV